MHWFSSQESVAPSLPAAWLIATSQQPRDLNARSALRRQTAHSILVRQFGLSPCAVAIGHDAKGRPLIERPAGTGLHISLATRAGLVAVALAGRPVGIDVERIDHLAPPPLAALHASEREALMAMYEPARPLAFAQIWSAKEAYVKALGTGFLRAPESFSVALVALDRFAITDAQRPGSEVGVLCTIKNGGQGSLAAAMIVLD